MPAMQASELKFVFIRNDVLKEILYKTPFIRIIGLMFQKPNEPLVFPALSWVQLVREQPRLQPEHRPHCQSKYCLNRDG